MTNPRSTDTESLIPDDGRALWDEWSLAIRTWGQNPDGGCVLLVGTYEGKGEASQPLLAALPNVILLSPEEAGLRCCTCWQWRYRSRLPGNGRCWTGCSTYSSSPDLLVSSDATVATIARRVGYGTPFSLSAAFKRVHGVSPQQYRLGRVSA